MGMDVYGKKPTAPSGEYFRNNVWWWRPLWDYCLQVSSVARKVKSGHTNDGDGLGKKDSLELARVLQEEIDSGRTLEFQTKYEAYLKALPRVPCNLCSGSGIRTDAVGRDMQQPQKIVPDEPGNPRSGLVGWCNACNGWGSSPDWSASYPFSEENVKNFAEFLRHCGGFRIC